MYVMTKQNNMDIHEIYDLIDLIGNKLVVLRKEIESTMENKDMKKYKLIINKLRSIEQECVIAHQYGSIFEDEL